MRYVVNEFVYKQTLAGLYNLSPAWIRDLGAPDSEVANPYRRRATSYLYYRPRVEALILRRTDAYRQMVGMRLRRIADDRAAQLDANLTRLDALAVEPIRPLPTVIALRRSTEAMHRFLVRKLVGDPFHKVEPVEPEPEELFHTALYRLTTYVSVLNEFMDQPGAGLAFLDLRAKAEAVATTILVNMMEIDDDRRNEPTDE